MNRFFFLKSFHVSPNGKLIMGIGDRPEALKSPTPGTNLEQLKEAPNDGCCVLNRAHIDLQLAP